MYNTWITCTLVLCTLLMWKPEHDSNHDLCNACAVLYQLSYQANSELVTLLVYNIPLEGEEYTSEYIWKITLLLWVRRREYVQKSKAKLWCKLAPGALLTFLPTYFLHNHLVSCWNLSRKNSETTHQIITCAHNCFSNCWTKKNKSSFYLMVSHCNQDLCV